MTEDDIRRIVREEMATIKESDAQKKKTDDICQTLRDEYAKYLRDYAGQPFYRDQFGQYPHAPPQQFHPFYSPYRYATTSGLGVR